MLFKDAPKHIQDFFHHMAKKYGRAFPLPHWTMDAAIMHTISWVRSMDGGDFWGKYGDHIDISTYLQSSTEYQEYIKDVVIIEEGKVLHIGQVISMKQFLEDN